MNNESWTFFFWWGRGSIFTLTVSGGTWSRHLINSRVKKRTNNFIYSSDSFPTMISIASRNYSRTRSSPASSRAIFSRIRRHRSDPLLNICVPIILASLLGSDTEGALKMTQGSAAAKCLSGRFNLTRLRPLRHEAATLQLLSSRLRGVASLPRQLPRDLAQPAARHGARRMLSTNFPNFDWKIKFGYCWFVLIIIS